jgi:pimeloyl-ACP methyl ester carboxylesterase
MVPTLGDRLALIPHSMSRPADWRPLFPFESHWLSIDGHRYHYLDEGEGPAMVLVHGNPTWSFYWRELIQAFRGKYRVVAPDHIGCGLSDKPSARDYPYRLARRRSDLCRLVETLDLRDATLVVHDWGGPIGLGAALQMPDRFARYVLLNTAAFRSDRCPWPIRLAGTPLGRVLIQGLNLFATQSLRLCAMRQERLTPAVRAGFLAPYDSWSNREGIYRFVRDIPFTPAHPSYEALRAVEQGLATLREAPVCLIWGMKDFCFTPHFLARFVEELPDAEVHRLEDAGHYVVEDAYETIEPIIEKFLERHPLA